MHGLVHGGTHDGAEFGGVGLGIRLRFVEGIGGDDGPMGIGFFGGLDGDFDFSGIDHGFNDDAVGSALEKCLTLIVEDGQKLLWLHVTQGLEESAEGADISQNPAVVAEILGKGILRRGWRCKKFLDGLFGHFCCSQINGMGLVGEVMILQSGNVGTECVGGDQIAAGIEVRGVNRLDDLWLLKIP